MWDMQCFDFDLGTRTHGSISLRVPWSRRVNHRISALEARPPFLSHQITPLPSNSIFISPSGQILQVPVICAKADQSFLRAVYPPFINDQLTLDHVCPFFYPFERRRNSCPSGGGGLFNWCLYGVLLVRCYVYSYSFPQDNRHVKSSTSISALECSYAVGAIFPLKLYKRCSAGRTSFTGSFWLW
ncbi:hypothetical protein F5148DRAFT_521860 [Russula earlei]|uniref:Uncharacterized protein n=1 Tax=Russula earlei TaxID=71964 RepID=A0ACC0TWX9_9AGAM|nr:hypothetical protein F5148DRAFT_521860 [Russula earlei]